MKEKVQWEQFSEGVIIGELILPIPTASNAGGWFPQTPEGEAEKQVYYSGGIVIDHENPDILYLSRRINGIFEIEMWQTVDFGRTWHSDSVTRHSSYDNVRPFAVRNAMEGNPVQVLWMTNKFYIGYRNFYSSILSVWRD